MMGSLALGQAGPQFAVLGAAQGAAASIFEVLDRVSPFCWYSFLFTYEASEVNEVIVVIGQVTYTKL